MRCLFKLQDFHHVIYMVALTNKKILVFVLMCSFNTGLPQGLLNTHVDKEKQTRMRTHTLLFLLSH